MSGICMAITLFKNGFRDVTLFEKAHKPCGTWRENTYPGLTCDIPSRFYQYSFALNPDWTSFMAPGAEIDAYFNRVAADYGVLDAIRFGTEVTSAEFSDGHWVVTTSAGDHERFDFIISAAGVLHRPSVPAIKGLDDFAGSSFHSARWDHSVALSGKRIGVIGTGSTGVQIVTALAGDAAHVDLFARTPQWVAPLPNFKYRARTAAAYRKLPLLNRLTYRMMHYTFERILSTGPVKRGPVRTAMSLLCKANLRTIRDRRLRTAMTPDYQPMCKRIVVSSGFYRAIQRPDVDVVTADIDHIEGRGVVTTDGVLHELDVLVLATGFDAHAYMRPMNIIGRDGSTLEESWSEGPRAFQTVAMPGFPNFFMLMGPHSPLGNYALTAIAETQAGHISRWIKAWSDGDFDTVEPTEEATERFNAGMRTAMPGTVWATGCDSWYLGKDGLPELWPWTPGQHRAMLEKSPSFGDYLLTPKGYLLTPRASAVSS